MLEEVVGRTVEVVGRRVVESLLTVAVMVLVMVEVESSQESQGGSVVVLVAAEVVDGVGVIVRVRILV